MPRQVAGSKTSSVTRSALPSITTSSPDFHALFPVVRTQLEFPAKLTPFCSSAPVQK